MPHERRRPHSVLQVQADAEHRLIVGEDLPQQQVTLTVCGQGGHGPRIEYSRNYKRIEQKGFFECIQY